MTTLVHLGTFLAAIAVCATSIASLMASRKNTHEIRQIHVSINSRMDALLKLTASSAKAEGVLEQKQAHAKGQ